MEPLISLIIRVQKSPTALLVMVIAAIIFAVFGIARLTGQVDFNDYFAKDDPRFISTLQISEMYPRHDKLWLLLENEGNWQHDSQQAELLNFEAFLLSIDGVDSVSGYNQVIRSSILASVHLKSHPRLLSVLSQNGKAVMLSIDLQPPKSLTTPAIWLNRKLESLEDQITHYWLDKQVRPYFSGTQVLNSQYAAVLKHDLIWFVPGLIVVFALMSALFIRQWQWILAITLNSLITLVLTIGVAGWLNLTLAAISAFIPVIVLTLSLAYSAHLFFVWQQLVIEGVDTTKALQNSVRQNALALCMASMTTVVGFLLLAYSPSPAINSFGILAAFAVTTNYLLSQTLLLFLVQNAKPSHPKLTFQLPLLKLINCLCGYPKTVLTTVVLISMLALFSVSHLKINDDPLGYFSPDSTFNVSLQKIQHYFNGINTLQYNLTQQVQVESSANTVISSPSPAVIKPSTIQFLFSFKRFLQQQPQVLHVQHIGDWIKSANLTQTQFNQLLLNDKTKNLLAAELSQDKQSTLVTLFLVPLSSVQLIEFEVVVDAWLKDNLPSTINISLPSSTNLLFAHLSHDNAAKMLQSFLIALLLLAVLIMWLKRSVFLGVTALLINGVSLLWVFGLWQLIGGNLSLGGTIVLCMMLGIIVDDTLHLILKLPDKTDLLNDDFNRLSSRMWWQFQHVIPVITFTTITIVVGFSLGLMSDFLPIFQLSLLSVFVMATAWFFDVFILPVLYLAWLKGKK